ncbi:MAG: PDZ domain-containing protein [Candidatus Paceibacterota bacterium]
MPVNYGAFIVYGTSQPSVLTGSLAEKYGIKEGDIILEINNQPINLKHPINEYLKNVCMGDTIKLKILRDQKELIIKINMVN